MEPRHQWVQCAGDSSVQPSLKTSALDFFTQFSSVHSFSHVWLFATPWTTARQASLSVTNSWSLLKLMSIALVISSNHLILCQPPLLPPSIFFSIRVFSNESILHLRRPKYWIFSFNISSSSEYSGLISFKIDSNIIGVLKLTGSNTIISPLYAWFCPGLPIH